MSRLTQILILRQAVLTFLFLFFQKIISANIVIALSIKCLLIYNINLLECAYNVNYTNNPLLNFWAKGLFLQTSSVPLKDCHWAQTHTTVLRRKRKSRSRQGRKGVR